MLSDRVAPEIFASDEQLARLEADHLASPEAPAMALAWALRQRDPERSLDLAREAAVLEPADVARLWLIEGERATAHDRLDEATALCDKAMQSFQASCDWAGVVDAYLLRSYVAFERFDVQTTRQSYDAASAAARAGSDPVRRDFFQFALANSHVIKDGLAGEARSRELLPQDATGLHPASAAELASYRAALAMARVDYQAAVSAYEDVYALQLSTGQWRRAVICAYNLANAHQLLNDFENALEWGRRMVAMTRAVWPTLRSIGLALNASLLCGLGQLVEARELAHECLALEAEHPNSRAAMAALQALSRVEREAGHPELALKAIETALSNPALWPAMRVECLQARVAALLGLGRLEEAEAAAALCVQVDPLEITAEHRFDSQDVRAKVWLAQGKVEAASQAYAAILLEAQALPGFVLKPELLESMAQAHAAHRDFASAYALKQRASEARERRRSALAEQRSRAIYAQHRIERGRLEAEHLRQMAKAAAERFEVLEHNHSVLEQLGAIGRELTAHLDAGRALAVLAQRVQNLMSVDAMAVYLLDAAGKQLDCALNIERGRDTPSAALALDSSASPFARCVREGGVLMLEDEDEASRSTGMRSRLFAPLLIGQRVVGVMSVQSTREQAFGSDQQLIFATLCAYAAIALDNARAYLELGQMQQKLRAQERLAALGSMVAGVAHELNTPLGNALMASSSLSNSLKDFEARLQAGALRRSDWQNFAGEHGKGLDLIERNVNRSTQLITNFKQVAQDRSQQYKGRFQLRELCQLGLRRRQALLEERGHRLTLEVDPALELDSYADALVQALDILFDNVLQHGLPPDRQTCVELTARRLPGDRVSLSLQDAGPGVAPDVLPHIFEPFFTTSFGQGSNGLGLTICANIVVDVLGGELSASSEPGAGACFTITMPLVAG